MNDGIILPDQPQELAVAEIKKQLHILAWQLVQHLMQNVAKMSIVEAAKTLDIVGYVIARLEEVVTETDTEGGTTETLQLEFVDEKGNTYTAPPWTYDIDEDDEYDDIWKALPTSLAERLTDYLDQSYRSGRKDERDASQPRNHSK